MIFKTRVGPLTVATASIDFYPDFDSLEGEEREEAEMVLEYIHAGRVSFESLDESHRAVASEFMAVRLTEDPSIIDSPEEVGRLYELAHDAAMFDRLALAPQALLN